ncbi:MAG TPA: hypothetical protein VGS57_13205 [Thermoanaerobaculia bacterium]|jgi:hypothetical protein|nr:hypothetical protein [Thermoanaerobaculia bacterium]
MLKAVRLVAAASFSTVLVSSFPAFAAPKATGTAAAASSNAAQQGAKREPPTKEERNIWRKRLLTTPRPKTGCFTAAYPETTWRAEACRPPQPHKPFLPHQGGITQILTVGGSGPDFSATVTGHITQSEGSFDNVAGVTSTNAYSLQLNTDFFPSSACSGSPSPASCRGWEQFVYESSGSAFMQYWLIEFGPAGTACPAPVSPSCDGSHAFSNGWCPFVLGSPGMVYCVVNAAGEPTVTAQSMSSLGQIQVAGAAASGATNDAMTVTIGGTAHGANGDNHFPDMGTQWKEAEFNVFGDGGGSQAVFNSGATLQVRTEVVSGTNQGPSCDLTTFTAESSNLTLVNSPPASVAMSSAPALVFAQSNPAAAGAVATCLDAVSVGDTHLRTFDGLFYDFQAAGDFTLAEVDPRFEVQTRQVSGAPTWPDATVNKAVAARFDKTQVAICAAGPRTDQAAVVFVDGKVTQVEDGKTLSWPDGGGILHRGNEYVLFGKDGDSVDATVNSFNGATWIDVNVGLGRWPSVVKGLIANPNGNVNQLATRDNVVLTNPFNFDDVYHRYADSWRVGEKNSLLAVCDTGGAIERGIPARTFYAKDLDRDLHAKALGVCNGAGVKSGALLDACILDVAVIGRDAAAKVFVGAKPPTAVGAIVGAPSSGHGKRWVWLAFLLVIIIIIVWFFFRRR